MVVCRGSNTLYTPLSKPKRKTEYTLAGGVNIQNVFSNKLVLFLEGIASSKLNYIVSSTYKKLNSILVRMCRLMDQKTKFTCTNTRKLNTT